MGIRLSTYSQNLRLQNKHMNNMKNKINVPRVPFYFVRHGQTDWNKENKVMGQIDIPLNVVGLEQAHTVVKNITNIEISHIVSSPLKRAVQTAEIIATALNKPVTIINEFTQNALGILEGRNKWESLDGTAIGDLVTQWRMGYDIESAESWTHFVSRVSIGLDRAFAINSDEKSILIVAHKPVYWALLHILNIQTTDVEAENCTIYSFSPTASDSNQWTVHVLSRRITK